MQAEDSSPADKEAAGQRIAEINEEPRVFKLKMRHVKERCLSQKKSKGFSKITASHWPQSFTLPESRSGRPWARCTKALAAYGKAMGASLKEIGAKLGSMQPCCELSFQNSGESGQLSRRAHLAADSCRGGLFVWKIYQKAAGCGLAAAKLTCCNE